MYVLPCFHSDVTASDKHGRSALHLVAADSSVHARRMVSLLLTHGSDVGGSRDGLAGQTLAIGKSSACIE